MVTKVVLTLKRKPGMTHEAFRNHYENSHVVMALEHFGHLITEYRRNYTTSSSALADSDPGATTDPEGGPDVVTELYLRDESALAEFGKILGDPAIKKLFVDDEKRFLNRKASRMGVVEVVESKLAVR